MTRAVLRATATLTLVAATSLAAVGSSAAGAAVLERGPGAGQVPPRSPEMQPPREGANPLRGLQRRCLSAAKQRADMVRQMQKAVDRSVNVTDEHEATLDAILADSRTGLTQAAGAIIAATTRDELVAACGSVVDLRIMSLVLPQVRITLGGDKTVARSENLTDLLADVPDLLDQIDAFGIDVSQWRAMLDEVLAQLDGIGTAVTDAVDGVLALTPDAFGTEATALMDAAVDEILGSRDDLEDIDADIEAALDLIDGLLDGAA